MSPKSRPRSCREFPPLWPCFVSVVASLPLGPPSSRRRPPRSHASLPPPALLFECRAVPFRRPLQPHRDGALSSAPGWSLCRVCSLRSMRAFQGASLAPFSLDPLPHTLAQRGTRQGFLLRAPRRPSMASIVNSSLSPCPPTQRERSCECPNLYQTCNLSAQPAELFTLTRPPSTLTSCVSVSHPGLRLADTPSQPAEKLSQPFYSK